jgi:MFS family permease
VTTAARPRALPGSIWAMGLASLCMDASSELVHSVLPIFLTSTLGASVATIGLLEGVAEATASVTKVASGTLSDRAGRRKPLMLLGYGLSALTKPLFPLASTTALVFTARFADRVGKGIRGAPRDALVADLTPPARRGAAYGLRQALDSVGACLGPLLATLILATGLGDVRAAMWVAVVPALACVALLAVFVREPARAAPAPRARTLTLDAVRQLPRRYWLVVQLGAVFTLARFSEAFLVLRAQSAGMSVAAVPAVMIVMNVAYAGLAYPSGAAADRVSRTTLLLAGLGVLVVSDGVLAAASSPALVLAGSAGWGLHLALTQGLLSALVADAAPSASRGTAFGVFNLVAGIALVAASTIAGAAWAAWGPSAPFVAGGTFAALTGLGVIALRGRPAPRRPA